MPAFWIVEYFDIIKHVLTGFFAGFVSFLSDALRFEQMEEQFLGFTTSGYSGDRSPDRADAAIWAINELFPALTRKEHKEFKRTKFKRSASAGGWMG